MFLKWTIPQGSEGWGKISQLECLALKNIKKKIIKSGLVTCVVLWEWNLEVLRQKDVFGMCHTPCDVTGLVGKCGKNMSRNVSKKFGWIFFGENHILIERFGAVLSKKSIKSSKFLLKLNFFWKYSRSGLEGCLGQWDNSSNSFGNRGIIGKHTQFTLCYLIDNFIS